LKIATWNVNSLRVRLSHVLDWLDAEEPDLLALQETKIQDDAFPVAEFAQRGYEAAFSGQPGYNGVALLARGSLGEVRTEIDGFVDTQRRLLAGSFAGVRIIDVYVPNGQRVGSEKYRYKLEWLGALRAHLAAELRRYEYCAVLGDFNVAPEDRDVHDPAAWAGKVLCSEPERAALAAVMDVGLADAFRLFDQPERAYSWWDYRVGAFRRNQGLRIDLILTSAALSRRCRACRIDVAARGLERPSDHAPVVAEFGEG